MTFQPNNSPILIMAGGLGTRLRPLTINTPKPMVKVGGKPLLEIMIDQLRKEGFVEIFLAVHYRKEDIQDYFNNGDAFGVNIRYIEESERLGTAGAIRLAKSMLREPFFVVNGDVMTKAHFRTMMEYHSNEKLSLTIASALHRVQIPYGVVELTDRRVTQIKEKPVYQMLVNAGIYCMNPELISLIPPNIRFDMTQLIERSIEKELPVGSYPICDYWLDVGQLPDYEKAAKDYSIWFGDSEDAHG